jgi:hypothetical protein
MPKMERCASWEGANPAPRRSVRLARPCEVVVARLKKTLDSAALQNPAWMCLAQDNDVVQTLTPDRPDQPFGKAIVKSRQRRRSDQNRGSDDVDLCKLNCVPSVK